ncbi:MAG: metalloregulator ArsR/SmtB family transcription factor [Thermomicrobia bacterium]|nr:metalloregulator ArsR/SmtB family transcription factor [Thermomicrobia bacterium]
MATKTSDIRIVLPMVDDPTCTPLPTVVQPTPEQVARCKALADETRLTLLLTLLNAETAVCACNLVPAAGVGQATVSHHLKVLREAGLVAVERRGIWAHYAITPDATSWLASILK